MNAQFKITEGTMAFLKRMREEHRLSQREVANQLPFNFTGYNQLEKGHKFLTLIQVWQLAKLYNITPADVINGIYGAEPNDCKTKLLELQEKYNAVVADKAELQSKIIALMEGNTNG